MEPDSIQVTRTTLENLDTKIIAAIVAATATFIVGFISLCMNYLTHRREIREKGREEKRKEIYKKLNDFYGPALQYLLKSKEMYELFKRGKEELKGTDETEFRTLTYLMRGGSFKGTDTQLLLGILDMGQRVEILIKTKSGLIDNEELRKLLSKAETHFELIRNAFYGKYETGDGKDKEFKDYVFPRELPEKIEDRIVSLKAELNQLNQ